MCETITYKQWVQDKKHELREELGAKLDTDEVKEELETRYGVSCCTEPSTRLRVWDSGEVCLDGEQVVIEIDEECSSGEHMGEALRRIAELLEQGYTSGYEPSWRLRRAADVALERKNA